MSLFLIYFLSSTLFIPGSTPGGSVTRNGMTVRWEYQADRIHFELRAPTTGWIATGINDRDQLPGMYFVMGRVGTNGPEAIEHHTLRQGDYRSLTELGVPARVAEVQGGEEDGSTRISFSLPIKASSTYHQSFTRGREVYLMFAYSQEDDFRHHSRMRTSVLLQL